MSDENDNPLTLIRLAIGKLQTAYSIYQVDNNNREHVLELCHEADDFLSQAKRHLVNEINDNE